MKHQWNPNDVFYIYCLSEPGKSGVEAVKYVGATTNLRERMRRLRNTGRRGSRPLGLWVRTLGQRPQVFVLEVTTRAHAGAAERAAIAALRTAGARLLNLSGGGEWTTPEAHAAAMRAVARAAWQIPAHRERHAASLRRIWQDPKKRVRLLRAARRNLRKS
jgi:L-ascorbate metabolism protein UlaG (beta-lactamase superfamily)